MKISCCVIKSIPVILMKLSDLQNNMTNVVFNPQDEAWCPSTLITALWSSSSWRRLYGTLFPPSPTRPVSVLLLQKRMKLPALLLLFSLRETVSTPSRSVRTRSRPPAAPWSTAQRTAPSMTSSVTRRTPRTPSGRSGRTWALCWCCPVARVTEKSTGRAKRHGMKKTCPQSWCGRSPCLTCDTGKEGRRKP